MHRFGCAALTAVVVLGIASVASATDLPVKAPIYKAPVAIPYSWTGFYVGANIGYSWGNGDATFGNPLFPSVLLPATFSGSQKLDGVIGGGQIGYNWQANNTWVFGVEADFQGSGEKGSSTFGDPYCHDCDLPTPTGVINGTLTSKILWFGTVRGRVGVLATPTLLVYGTGGLAYGKISTSGSVTDSVGPFTWSFGSSATNVGWTVGAGVEGAIPNTSDWTWKVEYLYIDFGTVSGSAHDPDFGGIDTWSTKVTDNIVRLGLNYRFH